MNKSKIALGGFVGLIVVITGCSGAEDVGGAGSSLDQTSPGPVKKDAGVDAHSSKTPGPSSDATECVLPGAKGNALGVGAYCQASSECQQGTFCTAGQAPKGAEFCTAFCADDTDCGEGASCYAGDPRGKGCVPAACLALMKK